MNKRILRCLAAILTVVCIVKACTCLLQHRYPCIRKGITMREAEARANSQDGYFIVAARYGTGLDFEVACGNDTWAEVNLTGDDPRNSLSWVFFPSNYFLVQGEELNAHNRGKTIKASDCPDPYTIDVKQWEIITPIHRNYTYEQYGRWFYPKKYIDEFDTAHGDYHKPPQAIHEKLPIDDPHGGYHTSQQVSLPEQSMDDTPHTFRVNTGGRLGTLLVTAELDKGTATEFSIGTIHFAVWDPNAMDAPLQTMTADTAIFLEWSVIDANFDGYMDFTCTYYRGNQPTYNHLWLWNEEQGLFERVPEFSEISMPHLDCETKTILGFARSSAASDGIDTFHRWEDGEFVCVRRIESSAYSPLREGAHVLVEDRIDGTLRQVYDQDFPQNAAEKEGQETWRQVRELWRDLNYHGETE